METALVTFASANDRLRHDVKMFHRALKAENREDETRRDKDDVTVFPNTLKEGAGRRDKDATVQAITHQKRMVEVVMENEITNAVYKSIGKNLHHHSAVVSECNLCSRLLHIVKLTPFCVVIVWYYLVYMSYMTSSQCFIYTIIYSLSLASLTQIIYQLISIATFTLYTQWMNHIPVHQQELVYVSARQGSQLKVNLTIT